MPQTPEPETYTLPPAAPFANHGRTKAAWVLMWCVCLGFLVTGLGLMLSNQVVVIVGVVLTVGGAVLSLVMRGMGLGQPATAGVHTDQRDWYSA
ncbi:HGxxPAAW family protein [Georgenia ruanii]|uniref:HGxxPAAW family protein n=1 Tax=Georgenia ruanii TaxID=348442 RepID=UPI0012650C53|nr:HGxxPAAW family protein [Georgenia ruanii]